LITIGGDIIVIIKKSENAKFITSKLLGVLRLGVNKKIYTTTPLPAQPIKPRIIITRPKILCQTKYKGGN
jgi:hypothetical protein